MEVDVTGCERRSERLRIDVGNHQHAAVRCILRPTRNEARWAPGHVLFDQLLATHAPDSSIRRTGNPAPAMAALTSAIENIRRWKIEAARTASALPSRTAVMKSAGPAAPPEAITGTRTRVAIWASKS